LFVVDALRLRFYPIMVILLAVASLSGCASVGGGTGGAIGAVGDRRVSDIATNPLLYVVTTRREVDGARTDPWFGPERASRMNIARVRLASPAMAGRFSFAAVGLADWQIESVEKVPVLSVGQPGADGAPRDVLIYVHGFNQTFASATLDAARLSDALAFHGDTLLFSWPSRNTLLDYVADRESAMWSRDALESTLDSLISTPSVGRIHIVTHSMGSVLTVEGLRQIYARRTAATAAKLGAIVLASPDLDIDSFASSVRRMGRLAPKMTIVTASDDRALAVASRVAGRTRVGSADKTRLERLGIKVIDTSGMGWGLINHDRFLNNEQVQRVIAGAIDEARGPQDVGPREVGAGYDGPAEAATQ
jgi:esterase/lipase superfamily enzyme